MSLFGIVAKNTLAQGVGKIASIILSIILTAYLTRILGLEGYGNYTFIISLVLFFGTISDWGTNVISVREASNNTTARTVIFGSSILFRLILSLFCFLLLNIVVRINPAWKDFIFPTTLASFVLIALSLKTSASIVFHSMLRLELTALSDFLSALAFVVLVLAFTLTNPNLNLIMVSWFVSTLLVGLVFIQIASRLGNIKWGLDAKIIKKIFIDAAPTGALLLVFSLYNRIDTIILQQFHGAEAVALYGLPYKMHDTFVLGAAYLMNSLFPYFSKTYHEDLNLLKYYYQKAFDILFVSAVVLLILVLVFAPFVVSALGGAEFFKSINVLRILSLATFLAYFNHLTGFSLIAFGKQKESLMIAVVALIVNISLNLIFVPLFSYNAAAIITVATECLVLVLSSIVIRKTLGFYPSLISFPKTIKELVLNK